MLPEKTTRPIVLKKPIPAVFQATAKKVPCRHDIQITVDFGKDPGPYLIIGLNTKSYCIGYLPKGKKK